MEFAFICMGEKAIGAESEEYFPYMGFVLRNVVQIYDDYDIDHIHKNVVHESLKH